MSLSDTRLQACHVCDMKRVACRNMEGKRDRSRSMPDYLTIDEVAELLGKKCKAVEKMVERRLIPFRKHGKRIIVSRLELQEFLDKLPGVTPEEAERRVKERVGRGA